MPPNQDPISWTPGGSMYDVNALAPMVGCAETVETFQVRKRSLRFVGFDICP